VEQAELEAGLQALGMTRQSWRALPLLPLVSVAWADGRVQEAERAVIERLARDFGVDDDGMLLVNSWLAHRPTPEASENGRHLLVQLCRAGGMADESLLDDVVQFAHEIARAAGGLFGFGSIDRSEADAIDALAEAMGVDSERTWVRPYDATFVPADADQESDGPSPEVHLLAAERLDGVRSRARLLCFHPALGERSLPVVGDDGLTMGRGEDNDVRIDFDARISRRHCRLHEHDRKFYIEDLDSTTGTWVNGQRVLARRLLGNEEIRLGSQVFFVQIDP
jgi:hypothetical protein